MRALWGSPLLLVAVAAALLGMPSSSAAAADSGVSAGAAAAKGVAAIPRVGTDLSDTTRTCARAQSTTTPTVPDACVQWSDSGPLNLIVVAPDPAATLATSPGWTAGQGGWLVAEARTVGGPAKCTPGWEPSGRQFERRLTAVSRRHVKLIPVACAGIPKGLHAVVADAHTDQWDRKCGDHAVDWDVARDQLAAALVARGGHISWVHARPAGTSYPAGCGQSVATDGRVAYVTFTTAPRA